MSRGGHGNMKNKGEPGRRLALLDSIRGITLISMICYHGCWDIVYILGAMWPWYQSRAAYCWQQSICWTFIFLSGLCVNLSSHLWKRGLQVSACGLLVTAVTLAVMPQDRVVYGVLTFLGAAMLILAVGRKLFEKMPAGAGLLFSAGLFLICRPINSGWLGFMELKLVKLPALWYHGSVGTFLGFTDPGFFSTDYFSMLPWIFLFTAGYYFGRLIRIRSLSGKGCMGFRLPGAAWMGQHSLLIYLIHQPVIYVFILLAQELAQHGH